MDLEICDVSLAPFTGSSTPSVGSELQKVFLSSSFMGANKYEQPFWGFKYEFASLFTGALYISYGKGNQRTMELLQEDILFLESLNE